MGKYRSYTITLGCVYNTETGKICKNPIIKLVDKQDVAINCIDEKKGTYEVQVGPNDNAPCLTFEVACKECSKCPPQIITKCFCDSNDDCDNCSDCSAGGECVPKCPNQCNGAGLCVDCLEDTDCPDGKVCGNGKCTCPPTRPYETEDGCVECIVDDNCAITETCVDGTCVPTECPEGHLDPVTGNCVACVNSGHCGDNESCVDGGCVCASGYIRVNGVCIPAPQCNYDSDCPNCAYCLDGECTPKECPAGTECNPDTGNCETDECATAPVCDSLKWEYVEGNITTSGGKTDLQCTSTETTVNVFSESSDRKFDFAISNTDLPAGGTWEYSENASAGFSNVGSGPSISLQHGDGTLGTNYVGFYLRYKTTDGRQKTFRVVNPEFSTLYTGQWNITESGYNGSGTTTGDYGYWKLCPCPGSNYRFADIASPNLVVNEDKTDGLTITFTEVLPDGCLKASLSGCGVWNADLTLVCGTYSAVIPADEFEINWNCCDTPQDPTCVTTGEPCEREDCPTDLETSPIDGTRFHVAPVFSNCVVSFEDLYSLSNVSWTTNADANGNNDIVIDAAENPTTHVIITYTNGGCVDYFGETRCKDIIANTCVDECNDPTLPPNITSFSYDPIAADYSATIDVGNNTATHASIVVQIDGVTCNAIGDYTIDAAGILTLTKAGTPGLVSELTVTMDNGCEATASDSATITPTTGCNETVSPPNIVCTDNNDGTYGIQVTFGSGSTNTDVAIGGASILSTGVITGNVWIGTYTSTTAFEVTAYAQGNCASGFVVTENCGGVDPGCVPTSSIPTIGVIRYEDGTVEFEVSANGADIKSLSIDNQPISPVGDGSGTYGPYNVIDEEVTICIKSCNDCGRQYADVCETVFCDSASVTFTKTLESCTYTLSVPNMEAEVTGISGGSGQPFGTIDVQIIRDCTGQVFTETLNFFGTSGSTCFDVSIGGATSGYGTGGTPFSLSFEFAGAIPSAVGTYAVGTLDCAGDDNYVRTGNVVEPHYCLNSTTCTSEDIIFTIDSGGVTNADSDSLTPDGLCYAPYQLENNSYVKIIGETECGDCNVREIFCEDSLTHQSWNRSNPNFVFGTNLGGGLVSLPTGMIVQVWDGTQWLDQDFIPQPAGYPNGTNVVTTWRLVDPSADCPCAEYEIQFNDFGIDFGVPIVKRDCSVDPASGCDPNAVTQKERETEECCNTVEVTKVTIERTTGLQPYLLNLRDIINYELKVTKCDGSTQTINKKVEDKFFKWGACAEVGIAIGNAPTSITMITASSGNQVVIPLNGGPQYNSPLTGQAYADALETHLTNVVNSTPFNNNEDYHANFEVCHVDNNIFRICATPYTVGRANNNLKSCFLGWDTSNGASITFPTGTTNVTTTGFTVDGNCDWNTIPELVISVNLQDCDGNSAATDITLPPQSLPNISDIVVDACEVLKGGAGAFIWDVTANADYDDVEECCVTRKYTVNVSCSNPTYVWRQLESGVGWVVLSETSNVLITDKTGATEVTVTCDDGCEYIISKPDWIRV